MSIEVLDQLNTAIAQLHDTFPILIYILGFTWFIHLVNTVTNNSLMIFGIIPRHPLGLLGIICSPFLHGSFNHLFNNSIFFLGIGGIIMSQGLNVFVLSSFFIMILSGSLIWIFGRSACHIGASALIIGYWSCILIKAYYGANIVDIIGAILGAYYFGVHILSSVLSTEAGVSSEGHFAGLIAGAFVGYYFNDLVLYLQAASPGLYDFLTLNAIYLQVASQGLNLAL